MNVRRSILVTAGCALALPLLASGRVRSDSRDEAAIREVVETAYIEGLHVRRDETAVRAGFHPDFVMTVHDGDGVIVVPLDMWLERLELDGRRNPLEVEGRFVLVDVVGETAVVKLEVHEGGEHVYTDYFGLYEFPEGWRVVNKIFQSDPSSP